MNQKTILIFKLNELNKLVKNLIYKISFRESRFIYIPNTKNKITHLNLYTEK